MKLLVVLLATTLLTTLAVSAQAELERRALEPVAEDVVRIEVTLERIDASGSASAMALDHRFAAGDRAGVLDVGDGAGLGAVTRPRLLRAHA